MVTQFIRFVGTVGLVLAGIALQGTAAHAAFSVTSTVGGSAFAGANYSNLDALPATGGSTAGGLNIAFTGTGAAVTGSVPFQYAAPTLSGTNNMFFEPTTPAGPDTTTYASTGTGTAVMTFATGPQLYFGLLWGSVDNYNTLSFYNGGTLLSSFTGSAISPSGAAVYVNFISTIAFTSVVASSSSNSFEFDNVAYSTVAVPEPSSLVLCGIAGLMGVVAAKKRAKLATV